MSGVNKVHADCMLGSSESMLYEFQSIFHIAGSCFRVAVPVSQILCCPYCPPFRRFWCFAFPLLPLCLL